MLITPMRAQRITFLHPKDNSGDKDVDLSRTGHVYSRKNKVKVREKCVPDWFRAGVIIVASDMSGNIIEGYAVDWDSKQKATGSRLKTIELDTSLKP